jgi:aspartate oxidase
MLFRGMMIDRADIPHFRKVGQSLRSTAHVARLLARYSKERVFAKRGTTLYLGNALAGQLLYSLLILKVKLCLNTAVSGLIYDDATVSGVSIKNAEERRDLLAKRGVVLATGGFSHRPEMRVKYLPKIAGRLSAACPSDTGDGIELATQIGAKVRDRNYSLQGGFNLNDFRSLGLFYNFECFLIFKFNGLVLGISREQLV